MDQCEISGDDGVKTAMENKKVSSDKVDKLKGELVKAVELVASERALRDEAVKEDIIIGLEQSPVGDSSGNGLAERAIQQLAEIGRDHKLA